MLHVPPAPIMVPHWPLEGLHPLEHPLEDLSCPPSTHHYLCPSCPYEIALRSSRASWCGLEDPLAEGFWRDPKGRGLKQGFPMCVPGRRWQRIPGVRTWCTLSWGITHPRLRVERSGKQNGRSRVSISILLSQNVPAIKWAGCLAQQQAPRGGALKEGLTPPGNTENCLLGCSGSQGHTKNKSHPA